MQPITQKLEDKFRGPANSASLNKWMSDVYYDLVELAEQASWHDYMLRDNFRIVLAENFSLQKKLNRLENLLETIQQNIGTATGTLIHSCASSQPLVSSEGYSPLTHNTHHNVIAMPAKHGTVSKLYLTSATGERHIPESLQCAIYVQEQPIDITAPSIIDANPDITEIRTREINHMFDGSMATWWHDVRTWPEPINTAYFVVEIVLPANVINHMRANVITIDPTPLSSISLLDIQMFDTAWHRLPTYPVDGSSPIEIPEIGPIMFSFPTENVAAVRIYGKQPNWITSTSGNRMFIYGFRSIDINYSIYDTSECRSRIRFTIPDTSKQFTSILSATPIAAVGSGDTLGLAEITGVYLPDSETKYELGEPLPALTKQIDIELSLSQLNGATPLISAVKIEYESA